MKKILIPFTIIVALCFTACDKPLVENNTEQDRLADISSGKSKAIKYSDGELELGEKINNPFTIENMEKALINLRKQSDSFKELKIVPNYYYVRILPADSDQLNAINNDESLDLYQFPLDYKILKQGNTYIDKSLGEKQFSWLYCTVPVTKEFDKSIKVEILEKLFLPFGNGQEDEYDRNTKALKSDKQSFLKALESEALEITGNFGGVSNKKAKTTSWYASGRIRVEDGSINSVDNIFSTAGAGFLPVEGCEVRARKNLFVVKSTVTDNHGNFFINHDWNNSTNVDYSIRWDADEFDIRSGPYGQAYFQGPDNVTGPWFLDIPEAGTPNSFVYAHVWRAAHMYYNRHQIWGIQSPPTRNYFSFWGPLGLAGHKLHINAGSGDGGSHYFDYNDNWFAAEVKVRDDLGSGLRNGRDIFATTIHELAHTVHWKVGFNTTLFAIHVNNRKLAESWAQMVGWQITRWVYQMSPLNPGDDPEDYQNRTLSQIQNDPNFDRSYTPLFIDLIDDFNQSTADIARPNDQASGYTLSQLEGFLIHRPGNWYQYRDYLINNSQSGQTVQAATDLFNSYDN